MAGVTKQRNDAHKSDSWPNRARHDRGRRGVGRWCVAHDCIASKVSPGGTDLRSRMAGVTKQRNDAHKSDAGQTARASIETEEALDDGA